MINFRPNDLVRRSRDFEKVDFTFSEKSLYRVCGVTGRNTISLVGVPYYWDGDKFDLAESPIVILGIPAGYSVVRWGVPAAGELYLPSGGGVVCSDGSEVCLQLIVREIEQEFSAG